MQLLMLRTVALAVLVAGLATADPVRRVENLLVAPLSTHAPIDAPIDIGEGATHAALIYGFYAPERDPTEIQGVSVLAFADLEGRSGRSFSWVDKDAAIRLWCERTCTRTLRIHARAAAPGIRFRPVLNGAPLEARTVGTSWQTLSWSVAGTDFQVGHNVLRLESDRAHIVDGDSRSLALGIDWIDFAIDGEGEALPLCRGLSLPTLDAGAALYIPIRDLPDLTLFARAEGRPGASLEIALLAGASIVPLANVEPRDGRVAIVRGDCCEKSALLRVTVTGSEPVLLHELASAGRDDVAAWRRATGLLTVELALACVVAAVLLMVAGWRRRWPWPHARWFDVLLVGAVATGFRLAVVYAYPGLEQNRFGDSWEYLQRARWLAQGRVSLLGTFDWHLWSTWIRPPGYFMFLALILGPLGGSIATVVSIQLALSSLTAVLVYALGSELFSRRAAVIAGLLFAVYLEPAVHVTIVQTETAYMTLFTAGLLCLAALSARRRPTRWLALLGGLVFGFAGIMRSGPIVYVAGAMVLLVVARGWRASRASVAVFTVGMMLIVGPVIVRNSIVAGRVMGVHNITGAGWLIGHPPAWLTVGLASEDPVKDPRYWDRVKRINQGNRMADANLVRNGLMASALTPVKTLRRFHANLVENLRPFAPQYVRTYLRETWTPRVVLLLDGLNGVYLVTLVFGIAGMLLYVRDPRSWPVMFWIVLLSVTVPLLFYPDQMQGRFRFPVLPAAMTFAGAAIDRLLRLPEMIRRGELEPSARGLLAAWSAHVGRQ